MKNKFGISYLKSWSYEGLPDMFLTHRMKPLTKLQPMQLSAASRSCVNMQLYATSKAVQLRTSEIAKEFN